MVDLILATERLREELENLISLKGLNHSEVLKLSQRLDKYILMYYSKE
ncbi:aspartyl-phosphate phosphatase Spo0E family protein [Clostridium sp.]